MPAAQTKPKCLRGRHTLFLIYYLHTAVFRYAAIKIKVQTPAICVDLHSRSL